MKKYVDMTPAERAAYRLKMMREIAQTEDPLAQIQRRVVETND